MRDSERLALTVLGWDGKDDVEFIVRLAGTMGVDLSALTQALLREQVRREVSSCREEPECDLCDGTGLVCDKGYRDKTCRRCSGTGAKTGPEVSPCATLRATCRMCGGEGRYPDYTAMNQPPPNVHCYECDGRGWKEP